VLLASHLGPEEAAAMARVAAAAGGRTVRGWAPGVTHVVCGVTGAEPVAKRTFKFMMGVLSGAWLVSPAWLAACEAAGAAAPEEEHEARPPGGHELHPGLRACGAAPGARLHPSE